MPVSGFQGINIKDRASLPECAWYSGPSLLEYLDSLEPIKRPVDQPLRLPINEKYKDMGTVVAGKVESGYIKLNQRLIVMPNNHRVEVSSIAVDEEEVPFARAGDNVRLRLKGAEEEVRSRDGHHARAVT